MFKPVKQKIDFPKMERELLDWWYKSGIVHKYLHKNDASKKKFSFLDGPITANNPMGVHHGWSRTYKDLWQRYHNMKGEKQRFQNGFDCQGLWVEVEVEKELGFKSKKDIERYGVAEFVEKCKERVLKYAAIQTEQSKRLGYFMDWEHSYFTMSDENNYAIWRFLKVCFERGWIYKGKDSVPWCPRCETAISQHEMLTEDYKEITHRSVYLRFPLVGRQNEYLLVWTTTPWTIPANICVAVDKEIDYSLVESGEKRYWLAQKLVEKIFLDDSGQARMTKQIKIIKTVKGKELEEFKYLGAFDDLDAVKKAAENQKFHTVVITDPLLLPITTDEGTGLVHTAVSAGEEDFKLGKKLGLPLIPVIADNADYLSGLGQFSGQNAKKHPEIILDYLEKEGFAFKIENYTHRYPSCWRCKTELVWKVADEWYIAMDTPSRIKSSKLKVQSLTLREQLKMTAKKINWLPEFGLERELDWLKNMHDWLISKKNRYWGLALPIYECGGCGEFEVIGGKEELKERAVGGWEEFEGHSPHKPFIDRVSIKCLKCQGLMKRILDVGNPWLDAGIVSFATMPKEWFPADFITESFPGQFKNWFYSLIVMSTVLEGKEPAKTILGFATLLGEDGRPMHKSWGNAIEFNEGGDKIGADVMRWMYIRQNPTDNLLFGYHKADEVRRQFHLMLWNVYNFFVTYANVDKWKRFVILNAVKNPKEILRDAQDDTQKNILDGWIRVRLNELIKLVTESLDKYDCQTAGLEIEKFVSDLSLWYVRRSRDRIGPTIVDSEDKDACYATLYEVLVTLVKLLAPLTPFMAEEMFKNLTGEESVHLSDWPEIPMCEANPLPMWTKHMEEVRKICQLGHAARKQSGIKVRQPLRKFEIRNSLFGKKLAQSKQLETKDEKELKEYEQLIKDELNVKEIEWVDGKGELAVKLDMTITPELKAEGEARSFVREVQELRKEKGCRMDEKIIVKGPYPKEFANYIGKETLALKLIWQESLEILTG